MVEAAAYLRCSSCERRHICMSPTALWLYYSPGSRTESADSLAQCLGACLPPSLLPPPPSLPVNVVWIGTAFAKYAHILLIITHKVPIPAMT